MYKKLFDQKAQIEMDAFFLKHFSNMGKATWYEKGAVIDPPDNDHIFLVLEGELNQAMYSKSGSMINYYRLLRGNIFGEIDYFDTERANVINKAVRSCKIVTLSRQAVEEKLAQTPTMYRYFLLSIAKKYRIIMHELANYRFNDAHGRLADFFLRLFYSEEEPVEGKVIDIAFTQEDLADRIGLNRITVTNGIKKFKEMGLIEIVHRKVIIKDVEGLKTFTDVPL
ncbi:Crp/Fnr family transcriptional regulator [Fusibacter sp. JL216-2]|uniref:Crp/Fnr family transcriptional regulator n=1 Tax=Fusibacter sp. JL216-2 TaxID=3071453 RepID=UPI003D32B2A7